MPRKPRPPKAELDKQEAVHEIVIRLARGESVHKIHKWLKGKNLSDATRYRYVKEARDKFNDFAAEFYFPPTIEGHLVARYELYQSCMADGKYDVALKVLDSLARISGIERQVMSSFSTSDGEQITFYFPAQGRNPELEQQQANGNGNGKHEGE